MASSKKAKTRSQVGTRHKVSKRKAAARIRTSSQGKNAEESISKCRASAVVFIRFNKSTGLITASNSKGIVNCNISTGLNIIDVSRCLYQEGFTIQSQFDIGTNEFEWFLVKC